MPPSPVEPLGEPVSTPSAAQTEALIAYHADWKEKHEYARHNGGRANGFTFEECGRAAQVIEMTLDILNIHIEGITKPSR